MPLNIDTRQQFAILFDLEVYVPEDERKRSRSSMCANPSAEKQLFLGGHFYFLEKMGWRWEKRSELAAWLWNYSSEKELLTHVYSFWKEMRELSYPSHKSKADVLITGIGVDRFDLPYLYTKCLENQLDNPWQLFEYFYKAKLIDLSVLGIGLSASRELYPVSGNDLAQFCGYEWKKSPGVSVWSLYESGEHEQIAERTAMELDQAHFILNSLYQTLKGPASAGL